VIEAADATSAMATQPRIARRVMNEPFMRAS
jgi:hypothetical protein